MRPWTLPAAVVLAVLLAGCTRGEPPTSKATASGGVPAPVTVAAVDFPSVWLAQQVGGDGARVERITAEQVASTDADLFVYMPGIDPRVDAAAQELPEDRAIDLSEDISTLGSPRDPQTKDPYVWFDPVNLGPMARTMSTALTTASPTEFEASQYFGLRALAVQDDARQVDQRLQEQLDPCRIGTLVVEAPVLSYFARAYAFDQIPLIAWRPGREPVNALYYTIDAQAAVESAAQRHGAQAVPVDTFTESAPGDDLLQGVLDTGKAVAKHQDCPLVTPSSSDRPG